MPFIHSNVQQLAIARNETFSGASSGARLLNGSFSTVLGNSYATAAGRPKAHMGRAAASKKSTSMKRAAKGAKTKAKKPKASKTKAKAKPKSKRPTEKQKEALKKKNAREEIKSLKAAALSPPPRLPHSAYTLLVKEIGGLGGPASDAYKSLPAAEREVREPFAPCFYKLAFTTKSANCII